MRKINGKATKEYSIWKASRKRCNNPNMPQYANYGGRGIRHCDRWNDFDLFLEDMGVCPSPKHTLERNDVNGDYCPSNCRWATSKEQSNNTRRTIFVTYKGESTPLTLLCESLGLTYRTILGRLNKGLDIEKAITLPVMPQSKRIYTTKYKAGAAKIIYSYKGEMLNLNQLCLKYNLKYSSLYRRLKAGWELEKAIETPMEVVTNLLVQTTKIREWYSVV